MQVGIYSSALENSTLAQLSAAVLAEAIANNHKAEIVSCSAFRVADELSALTNSPLKAVSFRTVKDPPQFVTDPTQPDKRYEALRNWSYELTQPYDLFINFADRLPLFCAAPRGVLAIQFSHDFIPRFYRPLWLEHLASYQLKLANSYYTRFWTKVFWDLDCDVVYPPVVPPAATPTKENLVVAVGSFDSNRFRGQMQLMSAFAELKAHFPEWSLAIIGDADDSSSAKKYVDQVGAAAHAIPGIMVMPNRPFSEDAELLRRAKILWHAGGTPEELDLQPQRTEPFNLLVLQGMALGCVPLVMNSGSLAEFVRHSENGFFWDTADELVACTLKVAGDESFRLKLSKAGKQRALEFRPQVYVDSFLRQLERAFGFSPMASRRWSWKRIIHSAGQFIPSRR